MNFRKSIWLIWLMRPLSLLYSIAVRLRNMRYNMRWKKGKGKTPMYTLVVGNLSVGGTGKTPMVLHLLKSEDPAQTAVLSRGYGRMSRGFRYVKADDLPENTGDEPLMIKKMLPCFTVAVCENRMEGLRRLHREHPNLKKVILDDAFQHRAVQPDEAIMLSTFQQPFYKDYVLPLGDLREPKSGASRADQIIFTKCPPDLSKSQMDVFRMKTTGYTNAEVRFASLIYGKLKLVHGENVAAQDILLVTGIANDALLQQYLRQQNKKITALSFPDHHTFSTSDVRRICREAQKHHAVVTTEKDWVRLSQFSWGEISIFIQPVEVVMIG